jgi:hypothetical protein
MASRGEKAEGETEAEEAERMKRAKIGASKLAFVSSALPSKEVLSMQGLGAVYEAQNATSWGFANMDKSRATSTLGSDLGEKLVTQRQRELKKFLLNGS